MSNRVIYDSILTSPSLARLKPYYQDQYPRWLLLKDDWGCFNADPDVIKGIAYPKRPETPAKIKQIRDIYERSGHLFVWADESGREWAYFVNHDKHSGASEYNSEGKRTRHRRKTPEPPHERLCQYLEQSGTSRNNSEQNASDLDPDPNPDLDLEKKKRTTQRSEVIDDTAISELTPEGRKVLKQLQSLPGWTRNDSQDIKSLKWWMKTYPDVDILKELVKLKMWLEDEKKLAKTRSRVTNWLEKAGRRN